MSSNDEEMNPESIKNEEGVSSPKVTGVLDDCLVSIFGYLTMEELFSVALANKKFVDPAALVFQRKYGDMTIRVYPYEIHAYKDGNTYEQFYIGWIGPFNEFAFLRIFGRSISKLFIVSYVGAEMINAIKSYVSEYCAYGDVTMKFIVPHRWTTSKYVPLKSLIDTSSGDLSSPLPPAHENLVFICTTKCFWDRATFVLEHLKHLSLTQCKWNVLEPPPITFTSLEFLEIHSFFTLGKKWSQFLTRHKNLIKMNLFSHEKKFFANDWLLELVTGLPKLKVLALNELNINLEFIPELLASSTTLKHLRLYEGWWDKDDYETFRAMLTEKVIAQIEDRWEIHADFRCAAFIRKIGQNEIASKV